MTGGLNGYEISGNVYYTDTASCFADVGNPENKLRLKCGCSFTPIDSAFFDYSDAAQVTCVLNPIKGSCPILTFYYGCGVSDIKNYRIVTFDSVDLVNQTLGISTTLTLVIVIAIILLLLICCIWCCCRCCHCCCYKKKVPEYYVASGYAQL